MRVVHFCSAAALFLALSCCAQDIEGTWQTTVLDHGHFLRYVLHISKPHGAIAATLDVPEHFQFDTPVDSVSFDNSILNFRSGQVSYKGSPTGDGQAIQGSWSLTAGKATWQRISPGPKNLPQRPPRPHGKPPPMKADPIPPRHQLPHLPYIFETPSKLFSTIPAFRPSGVGIDIPRLFSSA